MGASSPTCPCLELFVNGEPQLLAQYPNRDDAGDSVWLLSDVGSADHRIVYSDARPSDRNWTLDPEGVNPIMVHGYLHYEYADGLSTVISLNRAEHTSTITDTAYDTVRENRRYFVYNLVEELDVPGEYWLDRRDGKLYLWPPHPLDEHTETSVSVMEDAIITMTDVSHVRMEGLGIEMGRWDAVSVSSAQHVVLDRCRLRALGNRGLHVFGGSSHIEFLDGEVYATGGTGIQMEGGWAPDLIESHYVVDNTHVHRFGRLVGRYRPGVEFGRGWMKPCGGTLTHSVIEHGPHACVLLGGPLQKVQHNVIRHCAKDSADMGAVYWGYMKPGARGVSIRYNTIGHTQRRFRPWTKHGDGNSAPCLYVDGGGSGGDLSMNLLHDCDIGVLINSGKFTNIQNNVFVRNKASFRATCSSREPPTTYTSVNPSQLLSRPSLHCSIAPG